MALVKQLTYKIKVHAIEGSYGKGSWYDFNSSSSASQHFLTNRLQFDPQLLYLASYMPVRVSRGEKCHHYLILLSKHPAGKEGAAQGEVQRVEREECPSHPAKPESSPPPILTTSPSLDATAGNLHKSPH